MALLDLVDESFVRADPRLVAERVHDPMLLRRWFPDLQLAVFQDRGSDGVRWTVTGALVGTAELWLERCGEGVLVHYYLRVDPTARGSATRPRALSPRRASRVADRLRRQRAVRFKAAVWALKDELEAGRPVGLPRSADGPPAGGRLPVGPSGGAG